MSVEEKVAVPDQKTQEKKLGKTIYHDDIISNSKIVLKATDLTSEDTGVADDTTSETEQTELPEQKSPEIDQTEPKSSDTPDTSSEQPSETDMLPQSSLKQTIDHQTGDTTIDDSTVLKYLSEKLGKELTGFEELIKLTENPLDNDPYLKSLAEFRAKTGGRPLEDYVKFNKDYESISDIDIAREFLQYEYPSFTNKEINFELNKLLPSEEDLENDIIVKNIELKKIAARGRKLFNSLKADLNTPLDASTFLTPEIKQDLDFAKQVKQQTDEVKKAQQQYDMGIQESLRKTEGLSLKLNDSLTLDFNLPNETKQTLPQFLAEMPHWKNQDGSWNHNAVVQDGIKIKHFPEIMKMVFQQGISVGEEHMLKETNNISLSENVARESTSANANKKKGFIEGWDKLVSQKYKIYR